MNVYVYIVQEHPTVTQKTIMESVDELERNIKGKVLKLRKQQEKLSEAEHDGDAVRRRLENVKERISGCHSRIEALIEEKIELEEMLKLREAEIEILKESKRKERACLIALREEEVTEYQRKLASVKQQLKEEREKIPPLKEEIQQLLVELAKKSEEIRHLMSAKEETQSQLKMERERVEMKTKELTAAAVSKAEYMKEVQVRVSCDLDINMCGFTFPVCMYTSCTDAVSIT